MHEHTTKSADTLPKIPTAEEWMSKEVLSFSPDQDLFSAIELLLSNHFAAAPVLDDDGKLCGVLTEKDCLRILSRMTYDGNEFDAGNVCDYHSDPHVTCGPGADLFRVSELFLDSNFPLIAVMENDVLQGVISRRDVLRGIRAFRDEVEKRQRNFNEAAGHQADRPRSIESMQRAAAGTTVDQLVRLFKRKG